jgi:hypothetical protein
MSMARSGYSMSQVEIPSEDRDFIRYWMVEQPDLFERVLDALSDVQVCADVGSMIDAAVGVEFPAASAEKLVSVLKHLEGSIVWLSEYGLSVEDVARSVFAAVAGGADTAKMGSQESRFQSLFRKLSTVPVLEVDAKSRAIIRAYQNRLVTARVFSEIRPVFVGDPPEPVSVVIAHQLQMRLASGSDGGEDDERDFYVALKFEDLCELRRVVDRALSKHEKLLEMSSKMGVPQC